MSTISEKRETDRQTDSERDKTYSGRVALAVSCENFLTFSLTTLMPRSSDALSSSTRLLYNSGLQTKRRGDYEKSEMHFLKIKNTYKYVFKNDSIKRKKD